VQQGLEDQHWTIDITGSMSPAAIAEFLELWAATKDIQLNDREDNLVWSWTGDGEYTAKSAYKMLHGGSIPFRGHSLIWKTWAPLKVKIFLWLAFRKRHWTADRRARHGLEAKADCYLCDQAPETIDHLLCECLFTREVWFHILHAIGLQLPPPAHSVR
jgi:hypothetical protein